MDKDQFRELIKETLIEIGFYSEAELNLLMGTFAQESRLGEFIKQINGPALGIGQMEPATFVSDTKFLDRKQDLKQRIRSVCNIESWEADTLRYNLKFSIAMARVHYLQWPEALPDKNDIEGMARYWKIYYNSIYGKGTEQEFVDNYKKYIL